jgi:ribosomal protein S6
VISEYELTYTITPQADEEAREELNAAVDKKIAELKGSVAAASPTLRRRLAYLVQNTNSAFLRTEQVKLDPEHIQELHTFLRKQPHVLRISILKTPLRKELGSEVAEKARQKSPKSDKKKADKPAAGKKVTMEEVEKGIEEALTEEVK